MLQRAIANPASAAPADIQTLQRVVGNRAVTGLIQAKLAVGPVGGQNDNVVQRNDDVKSFAALSASDVVMAAYQNKIPKELTMELAATYKSSFDKTGFGSEYWATETANWVLHTHRGAAGGLKAGKIKNWTERFSKGKGGSLTVDKLLKFPGVKQVDNQRKDESGTID
ncbi:MAG: hypothetical protein JSV81_16500 [Anaerolineales bacterium]|nr:MAG: hypothetical protein JSV81_16500 [Anaerolineales bacterium]